ncbi:hypothetical protein RRG08_026744 [Elysia crispata]|uniref:Uncharacterized protein n=1 Tax=Elysia crispata TaxID=231223 RepID=A0AAE1AR84_9GAST|nr:hypothetical protein RRG08_026744 [Elysia crispata]
MEIDLKYASYRISGQAGRLSLAHGMAGLSHPRNGGEGEGLGTRTYRGPPSPLQSSWSDSDPLCVFVPRVKEIGVYPPGRRETKAAIVVSVYLSVGRTEQGTPGQARATLGGEETILTGRGKQPLIHNALFGAEVYRHT